MFDAHQSGRAVGLPVRWASRVNLGAAVILLVVTEAIAVIIARQLHALNVPSADLNYLPYFLPLVVFVPFAAGFRGYQALSRRRSLREDGTGTTDVLMQWLTIALVSCYGALIFLFMLLLDMLERVR